MVLKAEGLVKQGRTTNKLVKIAVSYYRMLPEINKLDYIDYLITN